MKKTIEVANVLLQDKASNILLLQRSPKLKRPYVWGFAGGVVEGGEGEPAMRAALRELSEEAGIEEEDIIIAGVKRFLVEMPDENIQITNVHARLIRNAKIILDPEEHIAYRWTQKTEVYSSVDLLPGVPTMLAAVLEPDTVVTDLTITPGTIITEL